MYAAGEPPVPFTLSPDETDDDDVIVPVEVVKPETGTEDERYWLGRLVTLGEVELPHTSELFPGNADITPCLPWKR